MGWWKCKQLFFSGKSKGSVYPAWIYVDDWTPASVYRWRVGNVVYVCVCLCKGRMKWGQCEGVSYHVPSSSILPHSDNCGLSYAVEIHFLECWYHPEEMCDGVCDGLQYTGRKMCTIDFKGRKWIIGNDAVLLLVLTVNLVWCCVLIKKIITNFLSKLLESTGNENVMIFFSIN